MDKKTAWQTLRDHAEGRIYHDNAGSCPDHVEGHDTRDPDCHVCQALDAVQGCLSQIEEPAKPVAAPAGPVAGYLISDPSDPEIGFWFSETPCAEGYTSEPLYAGAAPAAVAPQGEYPHEQMDAMALARYKVVPSDASMLWSHAVVAGDGAQQLYVGREVECQNMARKFAGAFLDGAFAFHSMSSAPTTRAAPAMEAPSGVAGRTAPRNDDERAAAQFFADNPSAALLAWALYLGRSKAPALEAPAAPIQHQGMTIAGNGAAELGKLMREQRDSRLGVYPDGNPNSGQP